MTAVHSDRYLPGAPATLGAVTAGVIVFLLTLYWHHFFPLPQLDAEMTSACDLLQEACTARFGDGSTLTLSVTPRPPSARQPITFNLHADGLSATEARILLRGTEMNMGDFATPLLNMGNGLFGGDISLPMCIRDRMTWSVTAVLPAKNGTYRASFTFDMLR